MPSNFKTYEAQSRLLAAVLASTDVKLNFKAIAKHYGSDTTESGIEHRFRPIKKQVNVIRAAVVQGGDAKDLEHLVGMSEKEIAKYYGESTPQGIEFQFRDIKKHAKALRGAVDKGESPVKAYKQPATSATSTPKSGKRSAAPTPRSTKSSGGSIVTPTPKRFKPDPDFVSLCSNEDDNDTVDYEALDLTPTKHKATPMKNARFPGTVSTHAPAAAATPSLDEAPGGTPSEEDFTIIEPPSQLSMETLLGAGSAANGAGDLNYGMTIKGEQRQGMIESSGSFLGASGCDDDFDGSPYHAQYSQFSLEEGEI